MSFYNEVLNGLASLFTSTSTTTIQTNAAANANGQTFDVSKLSSVVLNVSGTFSASIYFEGTIDDSIWQPLLATKMGDGIISNSTSTAGLYRVSIAGLKSIRARVGGYVSGTVTVKARGTALDGSNKSVKSSNSSVVKSTPVTGAKTVSTTAAEVFAGASRLASRYAMEIYNEGTVQVYLGGSGVTTAAGRILNPGDSVVFNFEPTVATAIYAIASVSCAIRVIELA